MPRAKTPGKQGGKGMQPNNRAGPLGRKNSTPPSPEKQVIGKGGRKLQQMGGGKRRGRAEMQLTVFHVL